ncbi:MAG: AAA family ATPase [Dysgonamonadaceae bacterium]|nr:AAA family ATPase [Dysgonamonadaceae bacterium]
MMKKNPQLLLLIGAPGSGKTTFAKYFIRTEENWMRLCRDDFRTMNFTESLMSKREEDLISDTMDVAVETLLRKKYNVLLDATHCRAEYLNHYIEKFNACADISFKCFECDTDELIARCDKRHAEMGRHIPATVIKRFVDDLEKLKATFDFSPRPLTQTTFMAEKQDTSLPKAIICDLDGTLALMGNRDPYDATESDKDNLNEAVANVLKTFSANGYNILLVSGREETFREPTLRFLEKFAVPYQQLWMRKAKDYRKDAIIKRELFDREMAGKYCIEFVLDDRDQVVEMWRKELKLTCFQVNYGAF